MGTICNITGKTRLLGVIGNPVGHSISPQLHNNLSRCLNIDTVYIPLHVKKGQLGQAVKGLLAVNALGFNITIPYKEEVIGYIDVLSKEAALIGAVNTVKIIDGKLYGYNTDASGFIRSFKEESGIKLKGKKVVLLGAGGAAKAIAVGLALEGVSEILIINRTVSKAEEIAKIVNHNISPLAKYYDIMNPELTGILQSGEVIINTTSLGMHPNVENSPIDFSIKLTKNQILYDVIYNPRKTAFLKIGEKQGVKGINGLGMLIYQGVYAYEIWTDAKVPDETIRRLFSQFAST